MIGKLIVSKRILASAKFLTNPPFAVSIPTFSISILNFSLSSAFSIASEFAPIRLTLFFSKKPLLSNSNARFKPV